MGSDHYPVVTSIGVAPSTAGFRKRPTWKFGSGTCENWTAALQQPELQGMDDLQREFTNFTRNLIEASHKIFKKTKEYTWPNSHHRTHFSFFITASIITLISVLISAFTALSAHCSHSAISAHCFHLIVAFLNPILDHIADHMADHIADHIPDHISDYVLDPIFDHILDHYF
ncbi:hypothetical protein FHG87_021644 [Trinorchestia longiramus]|nr:hypothetical protein FHG87_021644 [Trinorchestia longiramus]